MIGRIFMTVLLAACCGSAVAQEQAEPAGGGLATTPPAVADRPVPTPSLESPGIPAPPGLLPGLQSAPAQPAPPAPSDVSYRDNPFLPTMTDDERSIVDEEARRRREIARMIPQIRQEIAEDLKRIVREEMATAPAVQMTGTVNGEEGLASGLAAAVGADGLPVAAPSVREAGRPLTMEAANFTACINGSALYRDASGVTFINEKDDTTCAPM